jgi:hypothetical protein
MEGGEKTPLGEDRILLSEMVFYGRHGTLPAEHGASLSS